MNDRCADLSEPEALLAEIDRLRAEISSLNQRVETLDRLAHLDSLIDLPNRRGFMRHLDMLIGRVGRYGESAAMLFVDFDGLKSINDRFGHKVGDEALIHVAELLAAGVRKGDCVARIGGDEFGVLLAHADDTVAGETADRLAKKISSSQFHCGDQRRPLSIAVGIAVIGRDDTPDSVIIRADRAMYEAKSAAA